VKSAGGEIVVFSSEVPDISRSLAEKQKIVYPIVHDSNLGIARSFGLVFTLPDDLKAVYQGFGINLPKNTGHDAWELPMPSRFVIDRSGTIRARHVDPDYRRRMEPEEILAAIDAINAVDH
jgi:peroxiredoxin